MSYQGFKRIDLRVDRSILENVFIMIPDSYECCTYRNIMIISFIFMPSNPGNISRSMNLIETFRLMSAEMIVMFWGVLGSNY
jgi:hypothetical protein